MNDNNSGSSIGFIVGCLVGAIASAAISTAVVESNWQAAAIEHNAAQYSPKTGEFEWIKEEEK